MIIIYKQINMVGLIGNITFKKLLKLILNNLYMKTYIHMGN